jgi:transcriptional regulator with XRE-family HTH domain
LLHDKLRALMTLREFTQQQVADAASEWHLQQQLKRAEERHAKEETPRDVALQELEEIRAAKALMARQYVGKLLNDEGEQENPSMNVLAALGAVLGVSPDYFFPGTDAEKEMNTLLGLRTLRSSEHRDAFVALARGVDSLSPEAALSTLQIALSLVDHSKKMRNDSP